MNAVVVANTWPINKAKPYIFGVNDQLNAAGAKNYQCMSSGSRLARCRIFSGADQTHPVRDYCPALATDGTTGCLYDHVAKQRVLNALSGTFTAVGVAGRYFIDVDSSDRKGGVSLDGEGEVVFRNADASVTVTATEDNARRFVRWVGDVGDFADVTAKSVTFTVSGDRRIMALYTGSAYFDVATGVLSVPDGDWRLQCSVKNAAAHTINLGTGVAGAVYLSGSGKLDLNVPIIGSDGHVWTIDTIMSNALAIGTNGEGLGNDGYERLTDIVLPKTVTTVGTQFLSIPYGRKDKRRLKSIVVDMPNLSANTYGSGASSWYGFYSPLIGNYADNLTNFVVHLPSRYDILDPKMFAILGHPTYPTLTIPDPFPSIETAYDEYDFSRTDSLNGDTEVCFLQGSTNSVGGTLRLPRLKRTVKKELQRTNIENLELGNFAGSMNTIGSSTLELCSGSTRLRTVVLSATNDANVAFTIYGSSFFDSYKTLKAVFLTTDRVPTFDASVTPQKPAFGYWDHPAKSMCIYVPENSVAFASILSAARASADFNQAAAEAWAAANNLPVPVGVIPPIGSEGSLGTTRMQYIGVIDPARYLANRKAPSIPTAEALAALGEKVTVTSTSKASYEGYVRGDASFTVTAICEARVNGSPTSVFAGWIVNGSHTNLVTANPFTFTPMDDGVNSVRPKFVRPWLYDAAAGTIWNGDWKLRVQVVSGGLKVAGSDATVFGNAFVEVGEGGIDLSAPVEDASDNDYAIVSVGARALSRQNKIGGIATTAVIYPKTLVSLESGSLAAYSADKYSMKLERVEMDAPVFAAEFGNGIVSSNESKIVDVYLSVPKVKTISGSPFSAGCTNIASDVGEWDFSGVTTLAAGFFADQAKMKGTLRLPRVAQLPAGALAGLGVEGLELGSVDSVRLGTIGSCACKNMVNLKRVVFGPRAEGLSVASDAFSGTPGIERIEFYAKMPSDVSAVTNMLAAVPLQDDKQAMFVGSSCYGLGNYAATSPAYTQSEQAAAESLVLGEGETLAGVCLDASRRAWLVDRKPVYFFPGTFLLFR